MYYRSIYCHIQELVSCPELVSMGYHADRFFVFFVPLDSGGVLQVVANIVVIVEVGYVL